MRTATITDVKNGLSALIDKVRSGETILVTDRGVPVARIEPVSPDADPRAKLARLERAGILRVGGRPLPFERLQKHGPALSPGTSAVSALLDERRTSR